ncbi:hypothetical protein [Nocardia otitidiscaviarum]|uniref:hypothetical protein n=1 Tax=Nocardia otitidiscaviarum TaxID=1823 RepID=UPI0011DD606A|nr:hypothetical protein [Nocardia otitidiscaviarum]
MARDCVGCDRKQEGVMVDTGLYGRWHEDCLEDVHPHKATRQVFEELMGDAMRRPVDHEVLIGARR